jgi:predicted ester cyclase
MEPVMTTTTQMSRKGRRSPQHEEVQGGGNFRVFDELFADDFLDHTPQPGRTPDKAGARELYKVLRAAFPDFHAEIHWQLADGDRVTTYKTYHGTHLGEFFGVAPTGRKNSIRDRRRHTRANGQIPSTGVSPISSH